jgi:DNA repair protein RadC
MTTLYLRDGDTYREADSESIFTCADELITQRFRRGAPILREPNQTREYLRLHGGPKPYQLLGLLHLTRQHRLIALEDLFRGTLDEHRIHNREIVRSILQHNAKCVMSYHNDPAGISEPTITDERAIRHLCNALSLMEVRLLDHWIIGDPIFSFAEAGLL